VKERELGTVPAALRYWQRETDCEVRWQDDIASNIGRFEPLDDGEIDELCERLNRRGKPRLILEIANGIIDDAYGDTACELLVIDGDELAETELPDGERGYSTTLVVEKNEGRAVDEAFEKYA
jgi:hypothetical protein